MNLTRYSFYLTVTNISLAGLTALNFFFLAAALSPKQLGILSILMTIPSVGINVLNAGYNKAAIYYLGRKTFSLETIITNGLLICLILEALLLLLFIVGKESLSALFPDIPAWLLCLAVLSTPTQIFLYYLAEATLAAEMLTISIAIRVVPPMAYVLGCVGAKLGGVLSSDSAFLVYLLGIVLADLLGLVLIVLQSTERQQFRPNLQAARSCLSFGGKAQLGELAHYLAIRLDLILVGLWAGMEASGLYAMASRLAETIWLIAYSAQSALSAKVAQGFQDSLGMKATRLERAVRYMATGSFLVGGGVLGVSFLVFKFLLPEYQPAFQLLAALIPGQVALAIFLLLIAHLIGDGHPLLATKIRVIFFVLALLSYLALIPTQGALGAGLATSIAYSASTFIAAVILARMYQIKLWDFLLWKKEDRALLIFSKDYLSKYFLT